MQRLRLLRATAAWLFAACAATAHAQNDEWTRGTGWPDFPNTLTLALDPAAPRTIWGGTSGHPNGPGLLRSGDAGRSWVAIEGAGAPLEVGTLAIDPLDGETIFAGSDAVFRSDDAGAHWTRFAGPGPENDDWINALAIDPQSHGRLWAATGAGLSRSDDGGQTWSSTEALSKEIYQVLLDNRGLGTMYASSYDHEYLVDSPYYPEPYTARAGGPVYVSADGGENWVKTADFGIPATSFALDPFEERTVYAGTLGAFYRSKDYGASWETVSTMEPPNWFWFFSIVPDPVRRNRIYAAAASGDDVGVYRSVDGGRSWAPFSRGLPFRSVSGSLVISPDGRRLHVGTSEGVFDLDLRAQPAPSPCVPSATRFCLVGGRYAVDLIAARRSNSPFEPGAARPLGDRAGYFGLPSITGDKDLPEVVVKMLADGAFGHPGAPFFYSSLTTVPYRLTVTDTTTGEENVYINNSEAPLCGRTDSLFDESASPLSLRPERAGAAGEGLLQLLGGRFSITLEARHPRSGASAGGVPMLSGDRFAIFSLPGITGDPQFPEVVVKMVDARSFAGHFWFFHTGLTNLDYTLRVTDSVTGAVRTYASPTSFCGAADTKAFTD